MDKMRLSRWCSLICSTTPINSRKNVPMVIVSSLIYLPLTPPSTEFIQTVISYHSDRLETVRTCCCNVHHLVVIPLVTMMQMPRCGPHSLNVLLLNVRAITSKTFLVNDLISEGNVDCTYLTKALAVFRL
jgi:hypothetical protein